MTLKTDMLTDLAVFFNTDEFATSATYTATGHAAATIKVIFDKEYAGMMDMAESRLTCLCKTADINGAVPGETIVIDGTTYKIKEPPHYTADGVTEVELSID